MMMILEIDEGTEFDLMSEDLQKAVQRAGIEWPESRLIGTSPLAGKQLILVNAKVDKDTLTDLMTVEQFDEEGQQVKFKLGWKVLACEGEPVDQLLLLPYFDDIPIFNDDGEIIGSEPVTDLTGKLQVWAGKKWTW